MGAWKREKSVKICVLNLWKSVRNFFTFTTITNNQYAETDTLRHLPADNPGNLCLDNMAILPQV